MELNQASQIHRDAICPYFGSCGGCASQHITYLEQLAQKEKVLRNRIGVAIDFPVTIISDTEFGYRNRMDMIFHKNGIGFRKKNDWKKIIDIETCAISNSRLNGLIREIRDFFITQEIEFDAFNPLTNTGTFRYAVIRTPTTMSSISFVLNADSYRLSEATALIEQFAKQTSADTIVITRVPSTTDVSTGTDYFCVKGNDMIIESICGKQFEYSVQGFFQNNSVVASKMHDYVHELLQTHAKKENLKNATLLDLYGGVGTFGIINATLFSKVITAEHFIGCVESAKKNIALNSLTHVSAVQLDAKHLRRLNLAVSSSVAPLYVITDPPRSGMDMATIAEINRLQPESIIYISCNVDQLGKDIPKFKNYTLKHAALVDMFPQTPHIEGVVELIKK